MTAHAILIPWPLLARNAKRIRIPGLAVHGGMEIGKIDFAYEVLDEFQDWYEERTGGHLEDLPPEIIEKVQTYIYSILDSHWNPAKIMAALWDPQQTVEQLPEGTLDRVTKRADGAVFWIGPQFIGTFNKLVSGYDLETDYLLHEEDIDEDSVITVLNHLGPRVNLDVELWGSEIPELNFEEIGQIIEAELLGAEDTPAYYTEAHRRFLPRHAWEMPLEEVIEVLYSDDVVARRPLLLDIWPEFVVQIPSGSPEKLHSLIYHEYHTGERAFFNPRLLDENDVAKRHSTIKQKMTSRLRQPQAVSGARQSVGVIPRLRPVGHARLGTGELTLIRLSDATTQQLRKNHAEVLDRLEQPVERLAEECVIKLLQAQVDILDIVETAAKMICKKAR